ncbi:MAG TPA: FAD-dependent oxidoreductase [Euzebya sp.]|nr:FAD-dependent oxidoreductase [Euzebya sp.]
MATVERALVIGAGICGLTTAIALQRQGIDTHVFERADQVRAAGGGIHLWHNAMSTYVELGIGEEVAAVGTVMREAQFRTHRDRQLARWPLHELDPVHDTVTVGVARRDLLEVLSSHVPADRIHTGAEVTDVAEDDDGATATFADGTTQRGDVVVGADGIRSAVREAIKGPVPIRYAGYAVWQGTLESFPTDRATPGEFRLYYGPGRRFAWYHIGGGRLYWFALADHPEEDDGDAGDARDQLTQRFAGWPDPVPDLPGLTPAEAVQRFGMRDRPPDPDWSTCRVTLAGDAAHAMTFNVGQGACMGVEDALVLARSLEREPDIPDALQRYQRLRAPRTSGFVKRSWSLGAVARWRHPLAVGFRNTVMNVVLPTVAWRQHRSGMTFDT